MKRSRRARFRILVGANQKKLSGNLDYSTSEDQLRDVFAQYGSIVSSAIVLDRMTGRSRGFGFVEYDSAAEADKAIEALNGSDMNGRQLNVNVARERSEGDRRPRGGVAATAAVAVAVATAAAAVAATAAIAGDSRGVGLTDPSPTNRSRTRVSCSFCVRGPMDRELAAAGLSPRSG